MKAPSPPQLEERRTADFFAELAGRALAWIPEWGLADGAGDFGRALLEIAARFDSEVAERLDGAGEKMRRGFLDWLGVRGKAARPARVPVVFKIADTARDAVLASAPVRLQADAAGAPVIFETEADVRLIPGRIATLVAVDAEKDAIYLPPPGLSDLSPLEPLPGQWRLKSFAAAGATALQLDPEAGLLKDTILEAGGRQYKIVKADGDLVTIDPPLEDDIPAKSVVSKVTVFAPFDGAAHNWQSHALYLGDADLLNIGAAATIVVAGASELASGITWQYWGKAATSDVVGWQALKVLPGASLTLQKPEGSMEQLQISNRSARWIRAFAKSVTQTSVPFTTETLGILINPSGCDSTTASADTPPVAAEGMANTTPLVLQNLFFPLGKEPRQFDAFYLGSDEAFSKPDAKALLQFEMADRTFTTLSALHSGPLQDRLLAGVARDRTLHLIRFNPSTGTISKLRDPVQPPAPGMFGSAVSGNPVPLDEQPVWRLPVWSQPVTFGIGSLVAMAAGDSIWVWCEHSPFTQFSGWINAGRLPSSGTATPPLISGLVYLGGPTPKLVALRAGLLFVRDWSLGPLDWTQVTPKNGGTTIRLDSIVPVQSPAADGSIVTNEADKMIGINDAGKMFEVDSAGVCSPLLPATKFVRTVQPVSMMLNGRRVVAAVSVTTPPKLVAICAGLASRDVELLANTSVEGSLDAVIANSAIHVLAVVGTNQGRSLVSWSPYTDTPSATTGAAKRLYPTTPAIDASLLDGSPTALAGHVVVPGPQANILINDFDPSRRIIHSATIRTGIVVVESTPALQPNDLVARRAGTSPDTREIDAFGITAGGETFYPLDSAFGTTAAAPLVAFRLGSPFTGTFAAPDQFTLDASDNRTGDHSWLLIGTDFYDAFPVVRSGATAVATLIPLDGAAMPSAGSHSYVSPIPLNGRVTAFMDLNPSTNGNWDASLLDRVHLVFPGKNPDDQPAKAFSTNLGGKPRVVVLATQFQGSIANPYEFLIDQAFGEWRQDAGDTSSNPDLSWEYWNGKGWWTLGITDQTQNLKRTGTVRFRVPNDIASSDWAGKTNHWIRARLIGGDYGREKVTVTTKDLGGGKSEQTVNRSNDGIRPPSVLRLTISYSLCAAVQPAFVLTEDSGSLRDQSDANRTGGVIVEAFVPLAVALGRLNRAAQSSAASTEECPPPCYCPDQSAPSATGGGTQTATAAAADVPASGRAIFVGVTGELSGAPVNVLIVVDQERPHAGFAPMAIEALAADRLTPIVADDGTRALGESGVLSMAFDVSPTSAGLFGTTASWLRLAPGGGDTAVWKPAIRGAYLNAVWASATETLTRELLGSSNAAPGMTFTLARPPVLQDTLELRVKEPLGDEERAGLRAQDETLVLSNVEGLAGDWVLWKRVVDPLDEPPSARVYALDENTGEVRFGDGLHGKIPPAGVDSIVAFQYQRTEPGAPGSADVPANGIKERTDLNLVSPVESVETVVAAGPAAGGAPPESDERVLRYGFSRIRHRERAVTGSDLEDLALESSPEIVQARVVIRQDYVRLIVVMRGKDPRPSAAQIRELSRVLLASAPASLGARDALRIEGPAIRTLRIRLQLRVDSLEHAGVLGLVVKERIAKLLDSATGGLDGDGWPLGVSPVEGDIAFALLDTPYLESIELVTLVEVSDGTTESPWPATLKETELARIGDDPVRLHFVTEEASS